jgi:phosphohistidine swiveling domain-containing protein
VHSSGASADTSSAHREPDGATSGSGSAAPPRVIDLADEGAVHPELTGAKAAALATAVRAGLPTVPGFVMPTTATEAIAQGGSLHTDVRDAWRRCSRDGERSLVVRSSSTVEDLGDSSMAGRFESVVDVRGPSEFEHAVRTVVDSRQAAAEGDGPLTGREPIAVLVQPLLDARCGGVLFGIDPVSGREDRLVVAVVEGGPDRLVSGEVDGSRYEVDRDGREVDATHGDGGVRLTKAQLAELAQLAARAADVFGGPQDVEWAYDADGRLLLLQSRPVTATPRGVPDGPVLGPGPVAETFPQPLRRLEVDLWVPPLRAALEAALRLAGTASKDQVTGSPVVVVFGGRVAVDLELVEPGERTPTVLERLDPRPRVRRLRASWRVGRLRAALPGLGHDVLDRVDETLAGVPAVDTLTDRQLVALLHRSSQALASVNAHEVLVGLLADAGTSSVTGTSVALRVLAQSRAAGLSDAEILAASPVVLALAPPRVAPGPELPVDVVAPEAGDADGRSAPDSADAAVREALRLRARWLQELTARAAWRLGERLAETGRLPCAEAVADVPLADLAAAVRDAEHPLEPAPTTPADPLPARFRLSDRGLPVPLRGTGSGTGAGGGTGTGPVHHGDDPPEGAVLVVRTLDPALASVLPRLSGLVAETGSVLAHLAILARESGVPTVVGLAGAVDDLPPGTVVEVDGDAGTVERKEEAA